MKSAKVGVLVVLLMGLWAGSSGADALFIGSSTCPAPPGCPVFGTEVNGVGPSSIIMKDQGNGGGPLLSPVLLIIGEPNATTPPPAISSLTTGTGSLGGAQFYPTNTPKWDGSSGFAGSFTAAFQAANPGNPGVYNFIGLNSPDGGSESFVNWAAADLAVNKITATSFGIFVYELTGTGLSGGTSVGINFASPLPVGTFIVGYGCTGVSNATGSPCLPVGNTATTPFTQVGMVVPEPSSLLLLVSGLIGLGALMGKRFFEISG